MLEHSAHTLAQLEALIQLCRKHGVAQLRVGDTHLVLEARAYLPPTDPAPEAPSIPENPMLPTSDDLQTLLHGAR
jgi:hypothetical protein